MSTHLRAVVAGVAGYGLFLVCSVLLFWLSGYDPHSAVSRPFQIFSIVSGIVFAFVSGYITAGISPEAPMLPAMMVALLIAVTSILSMMVSGSAEMWSQLSTLLLMAPTVVVGARVRRDRAQNLRMQMESNV